jgi:hypothetical protein
VSKPKNALPDEVIKIWPDIFKDIEVQAIPLEYLHSITVEFHTGKTWLIEIGDNADHEVDIEQEIENLFMAYDSEISSVNFKLDTERVKQDISKRTKLFMKKRR